MACISMLSVCKPALVSEGFDLTGLGEYDDEDIIDGSGDRQVLDIGLGKADCYGLEEEEAKVHIFEVSLCARERGDLRVDTEPYDPVCRQDTLSRITF